VKKTIGFVTNAIRSAEELARPCSGDHKHMVLIGEGRARRAQVYPVEICKSIISGLRDQMTYDGRLGSGLTGAADAVHDNKE